MSAVEMLAPGDVPFLVVGDVLKRLAYGDSLATKASHGERHQVPAVWDGPLMSDALRGVEHHCLLCLFGFVVPPLYVSQGSSHAHLRA